MLPVLGCCSRCWAVCCKAWPGGLRTAFILSLQSSSILGKMVTSLEEENMRFPRTQGAGGEQMICILNEDNLCSSRQRSLGCGQVRAGSPLCWQGLAGVVCESHSRQQ